MRTMMTMGPWRRRSKGHLVMPSPSTLPAAVKSAPLPTRPDILISVVESFDCFGPPTLPYRTLPYPRRVPTSVHMTVVSRVTYSLLILVFRVGASVLLTQEPPER